MVDETGQQQFADGWALKWEQGTDSAWVSVFDAGQQLRATIVGLVDPDFVAQYRHMLEQQHGQAQDVD